MSATRRSTGLFLHAVAALALLALQMAHALQAAPLNAAAYSAYQPAATVSGVIRIWGPREMAAAVAAWNEGFSRFQPGAHVAAKLMGSGTAMPGLYGGQADIALLGRETNITDDNGFGRVKQYPPLQLELMTGSLAAADHSPALVALVDRRNPLHQVSITQLRALLSCADEMGTESIRSWGQLGLTGAWAGRPIHVYVYDLETGTGQFMLRTVLGGNLKLRWEAIHEFRDGGAIAAALARDPQGLALGHLGHGDRQLKALPIAAVNGRVPVLPTSETLIDGSYPLTRHTYAFIDRAPGATVAPLLREFLRYTLSREGQQAVARQPGYLPLSPARAAQQRERLP